MIFSAVEIALSTLGELQRPGEPGPICTDSRALRPGDWFLALSGERFDASDFLPAAAEAGCAGAISQRFPEGWSRGAVRVQDPLLALQALASLARDRLEGAPVVGITGSAGKTTTRAMVGAALSSLGLIHQTQGNLNNHIGVPLTLLSSPEIPDAVVIEMGMSGPGEIALLQHISRPTVRLITNVGAAHVQGAGSIEGVARCKQELFDGARPGDVCLINADDPRVASMPIPPGARALRYGSSPGCDFRLLRASLDPETLSTRVHVGTDLGEVEALIAAPGLHLASNACAAVGVARVLGIAPPQIGEALSRYAPVGMRMRVERRGGRVILNDAYNANPLSVAAALKTLAAAGSARKVALLGDMLELGPVSERAHAEIAELAGQLGLDLLGLAGANFAPQAPIARSAGAKVVVAAPDSDALRAALRDQLKPGDLILVKGSRGMQMERLLQDLPAEDR